MPKPARLRQLKISEVSLVDRPANPEATVLLAKRDEATPDDDLTPEAETTAKSIAQVIKDNSLVKAVAKYLGLVQPGTPHPAGDPGSHTPEDEQMPPVAKTAAEIEAIVKRNEELEALVKGATCTKCGGKMLAKGDKMSCEKGCVMKDEAADGDEEIEKAAIAKLPESVRKQLAAGQDAVTRIAKLEAERADEAVAVLAKGMIGDTATNVDGLKAVLKQLNSEGQTFVQTMLKQHNALIEQSGLFDTRGRDVEGTTTLTKRDKLNAAAAELRKADTKLTVPKSIAMALDQNPDLY